MHVCSRAFETCRVIIIGHNKGCKKQLNLIFILKNKEFIIDFYILVLR